MATHGLDCRHWRMTPAERLGEKLAEVRFGYWIALGFACWFWVVSL